MEIAPGELRRRTPDELLDDVRNALSAADQLTAFAELDDRLRDGDALPTDWAMALDRPPPEDVPAAGDRL